MKAVLIVEDHPLVAEATKELLSRSDQSLRVVICSDTRQALERLNDSNEDWFRILLDLDVPGAYGLSLARQVRQRGLHPRCCVITGCHNPDFIAELEGQGFLGYIVKATPMAEFTLAVGQVLEGARVFPVVTPRNRSSAVRLTRRQSQLLDCVRRGMLSKQIAADLSLSEGTVNNHINATMRTLKVTTRTHAVSRAIELGLIGIDGSPRAAESA